MIRERARVLEPFDGGAWVSTGSRTGCARCAAGQGCGSATLGRLLGDRLQRVEVASAEPLAAEAWVEIAIDERMLSAAAALVYGLPLALLLVGAWAGDAAFADAAAGRSVDMSADLAAGLGAALGLGLGLRSARAIARRLAPRALKPRVLRTLGADEACAG